MTARSGGIPRAARRGARLGRQAGGAEEVKVHAIRKGMGGFRAAKSLFQNRGTMRRAGNNRIGHLDDGRLQMAPPGIGHAVLLDEPMVEHLAGQTPLEVEHRRNTTQPADNGTDERSLMQVAMDNVGVPAQGLLQRTHEQQHIESDLVAR